MDVAVVAFLAKMVENVFHGFPVIGIMDKVLEDVVPRPEVYYHLETHMWLRQVVD